MNFNNKGNSMEKKNYRHGDVIIVPTTKGVRGKEKEDKALAYGEVTGHSHRMTEGLAAVFQFNDEMYLKVISERAALTHEEHSRIDLPAGDYEVIIQRDYIPGGWTKVID